MILSYDAKLHTDGSNSNPHSKFKKGFKIAIHIWFRVKSFVFQTQKFIIIFINP